MGGRRLVRFPVLAGLPFVVLVLTAGQCSGAVNRPPVAVAGEDRTVEVGALVTLDGGASSDPDGDTLSFAWLLETVPTGSTATLSDAEASASSFHVDVAGVYVVTLTVSDGELEASDSVTVTAGEAPNGTPNEAPGLSNIDDQRTPMNEPIEVAFTVNDEVPDGVTVEASSSDATLVAVGAMEVLGGGAERSLRIVPAPMGLGTVSITLLARDVQGLEDSVSFALQVARPFDAQLPKLTASDAAEGDRFGSSVAISGGHAVVGAPRDDDDGTNSGSAYVFSRSGGVWTQSAKLPPDRPVVGLITNAVSAGDGFGSAVAIDGDYVIVGAPLDDTEAVNAGTAYIYERCRSTFVLCDQPWVEMGVLTAHDASAGDRFGRVVAIDGDYALVGAFLDDDGGMGSGSAYVFQRTGGTWSQTRKLVASDAAEGDWFGLSVAIDGDYALIGASLNDDSGLNSGSAYVFQRTGDEWNQARKLTSSDAAEGDHFGVSVAIDGAYVLVGAHRDSDDGTNSGSAYVFERSGDAWNQTAKLTANDADEDHRFGWSVSIAGGYAIVGAPTDITEIVGPGSAYVFQRSGDAWNQTSKLVASDAALDDFLGGSVAISRDYALVGAAYDDAYSGAGYVYLR